MTICSEDHRRAIARAFWTLRINCILPGCARAKHMSNSHTAKTSNFRLTQSRITFCGAISRIFSLSNLTYILKNSLVSTCWALIIAAISLAYQAKCLKNAQHPRACQACHDDPGACKKKHPASVPPYQQYWNKHDCVQRKLEVYESEKTLGKAGPLCGVVETPNLVAKVHKLEESLRASTFNYEDRV